jgi:tripartite-type tricarboxylate transporter receptor subunit TctC
MNGKGLFVGLGRPGAVADGPRSANEKRSPMHRAALRLTSVLLTASALAVAAQPAGGAQSASFPQRAIRIIVPFSPGASTDIVGRMLAAKLSEALGQPVVVENRVGAGGTIGGAFAAKATPDGHTLFMGSVGSLGTSSGLYRNLPYDPVKDFAPITLAVRSASVLLVHPSITATSVKELVAQFKAKAGGYNYSSSGNGSPSHLAMELFKSMTGVAATHVPYKGPAEAMNDLLSGQVQLSITSVVGVMHFVRSGRLRALATTGRTRMAELPDLPTMIEAGVPGYEVYVWYGVLAPAGTPRDIVLKLNAELVRILNLPDVKSKLLAQGGELATCTPEEFHEFIKTDVARWNHVIKISGTRVN